MRRTVQQILLWSTLTIDKCVRLAERPAAAHCVVALEPEGLSDKLVFPA